MDWAMGMVTDGALDWHVPDVTPIPRATCPPHVLFYNSHNKNAISHMEKPLKPNNLLAAELLIFSMVLVDVVEDSALQLLVVELLVPSGVPNVRFFLLWPPDRPCCRDRRSRPAKLEAPHGDGGSEISVHPLTTQTATLGVTLVRALTT
jgi:hypothetical protein